jgi:hypothetical protein
MNRRPPTQNLHLCFLAAVAATARSAAPRGARGPEIPAR